MMTDALQTGSIQTQMRSARTPSSELSVEKRREKKHVYGMKFQCQRFRCIKGIKRIESNRIEARKKGRNPNTQANTHTDVGATGF